MSGLVGSITNASKKFNDIAINNTIEGMKMANFVDSKTKQAKKDAKATRNQSIVEELNPSSLVENIQKDMEDDRAR